MICRHPQVKYKINTSKHTSKAQKIVSCISLTKRAHKPNEMGMPSKMHPRDKVRAHLSAS